MGGRRKNYIVQLELKTWRLHREKNSTKNRKPEVEAVGYCGKTEEVCALIFCEVMREVSAVVRDDHRSVVIHQCWLRALGAAAWAALCCIIHLIR